MKELKDCGCGNAVELEYDKTFYRVECYKCGNVFLGCTNRQHVVDGWNGKVAEHGASILTASIIGEVEKSRNRNKAPIVKSIKPKVAKVIADKFMDCDGDIVCKIDMTVNRQPISLGVFRSYESAIRGARRFCKAIGYEMEVVK